MITPPRLPPGLRILRLLLPVAALAGFLITGGEVKVPEGTRATAKVAADTVLPPGD